MNILMKETNKVMTKKVVDLWRDRHENTHKEFRYDLERCTTIETRNELIDRYLMSQLQEYDQEKKNDVSKSWPYIDYVKSFIIPVPWHTACGLNWEEYYDPCIVIDSDYDDGGL